MMFFLVWGTGKRGGYLALGGYFVGLAVHVEMGALTLIKI
jgi:hypothetical protein